MLQTCEGFLIISSSYSSYIKHTFSRTLQHYYIMFEYYFSIVAETKLPSRTPLLRWARGTYCHKTVSCSYRKRWIQCQQEKQTLWSGKESTDWRQFGPVENALPLHTYRLLTTRSRWRQQRIGCVFLCVLWRGKFKICCHKFMWRRPVAAAPTRPTPTTSLVLMDVSC